MALQPQLEAVYNELLQADGSEFYMSPADSYVDLEGPSGGKVTWEALCESARSRGEIAVGV